MFSFKKSYKKRWIKYYAKSNWPIVVDVASVLAVFALLALFLSLYFYNPSVLLGPNFSQKKPENIESEKYVLDLDNPPLETKLYFSDKYLSKEETSSTLKMELKNNSNQELKDLKIKISPSDKALNITGLELSSAGENVRVISDDEVFLNYLAAGEEKNISLRVNWSDDRVAGKRADLKIDSQYLIMNQVIKKVESILSPRVESTLSAQSMILYTSIGGDKLGLGPIPPIATLPTNYWLFWEVENKGELKNFIMSAKLAAGVNLTERYSLLTGDFSYDKENRLIIWKIDRVEDGSDSIRLGLELQLIPAEDQVGKTLNLIEKTEYLAIDPYTNNRLAGTLNNIDTNLPRDKFNQGMGIVRSFSEY